MNIDFQLNFKYKNYDILSKKIENFESYDIGTDLKYLNQIEKEAYNYFLNIKKEMIDNQQFSKKIKVDIPLFTKGIVSLKDSNSLLINKKLLVGRPSKTLSDAINDSIMDLVNELTKNKINIDDILSCFRLINFNKELNVNPSKEYLLQSFAKGNIVEEMNKYIYGLDFERLNIDFIQQFHTEKVSETPNFKDWNHLNFKRQHELFMKSPQNNMTLEEFIYANQIPGANRYLVPSLDAQVNTEQGIKYFEIKNYSHGKQDISLRSNHDISKQVRRLNIIKKLNKFNSETFYNINLYNTQNNTSEHFFIPIEDMIKFYTQIEKKTKMQLKIQFRNTKTPDHKLSNYNFKIAINNIEVEVQGQSSKNIVNNVSYKNKIETDSSISISNSDFNIIFESFKINIESKEKEILIRDF